MKGTVVGTLSVEIFVPSITDVQTAVDKLTEAFKGAEVDTDDNMVFFYMEDKASYYYQPAVMYYSDGSGSPEEYEDELPFCDEDDVVDEINTVLKGIDFEVDDVKYSRKYDDDGWF